MEAVLELLGTLLVILGVGAGVWAIATGHIYGTFKAATENPLFAVAAIAGIVFVVAGLILGNVSLSGAVHNFENGVGWVLTIGGILLLMALVTGITQDRIKTARRARASAQDSSQPTAAQPDKPQGPHQPTA
jgi:type VI protein secretion system component VasK